MPGNPPAARRHVISLRLAVCVLAAIGPTYTTAAAERLKMHRESAPIRVMSFNIRFGTADDGDNHWRRRDSFLIDVVRDFDPDLLGTQEVLDFQADYLREKLSDYVMSGVGRDDGRRAGEFSALFARKSRFDLIESGTFWLSEDPARPGSKSWDSALPRIVSWARLRDRTTERELFFLNTHWDHRGEQARLESARLMRRWILDHAAGSPVIVSGDFNTSESSDPHVALVQATDGVLKLHDAYRSVVPSVSADEATFHGFTGSRSGQRIDWILATEHFAARDAAMVRTARDGRYPSDHFPVTASLEWLTAAQESSR